VCHVHLMLRGHLDAPPGVPRLLRSHPEVAGEYGELKRSLAGAVGDDRHAYMSAKGEFIERITANRHEGATSDAMKTIANALIGLVALSHVGFLILEMFFWNHPVGRRIFGMTPEVSASSATLAANQGLYNGFLAAGLAWALWADRRELKIFFLGCVIVAGVFGGLTAKTSILVTQALPAAIALAFVMVTPRR
jgi:putative membrane protein